jgi:hypothetical protein
MTWRRQLPSSSQLQRMRLVTPRRVADSFERQTFAGAQSAQLRPLPNIVRHRDLLRQCLSCIVKSRRFKTLE